MCCVVTLKKVVVLKSVIIATIFLGCFLLNVLAQHHERGPFVQIDQIDHITHPETLRAGTVGPCRESVKGFFLED